MNIIEILQKLITNPDLASKKWIYEQYDSQVMNDTISTKGDASVVRVHNKNKALAISTDCTPRYVEADPFEGAKQAVAETYRNISAVGGTPLAITNCLNFGNPQKPEIMGQIVRAVKGITQASKELDYPVISGNVSLYNETDGAAIQPTPAIGGVGLLKDLNKRCDIKFKNEDDKIFVIGKTSGHISCSLYQRDILGVESKENPPKVDLELEKKNAAFIRDLISKSMLSACHDVSDGGILVTIFEMCSKELGCKINCENLINGDLKIEEILFAEDQARYIVSINEAYLDDFLKMAKKSEIDLFEIGNVAKEKIYIQNLEEEVDNLIKLNELVFEEKFANF